MVIRLVESFDSLNLFNLIDKNRNYLRTYFPKTVSCINNISTSAEFIKFKLEQAEKKEAFFFIVILREEMVGAVIIKEIDESIPKGEIAYFIDEDYQGHGITSASVRWLCNFCFESLKFLKVYAKVNPSNTGSIKVLLKNSFVEEGLLKKDYRDGNGDLCDSVLLALYRPN